MKLNHQVVRFSFIVDKHHPFGHLVPDKNGDVVLFSELPNYFNVLLRKNECLLNENAKLLEHNQELRATINSLRFKQEPDDHTPVWFWQNDEYDDPATLSCPIVIEPGDLLRLIRGKE